MQTVETTARRRLVLEIAVLDDEDVILRDMMAVGDAPAKRVYELERHQKPQRFVLTFDPRGASFTFESAATGDRLVFDAGPETTGWDSLVLGPTGELMFRLTELR